LRKIPINLASDKGPPSTSKVKCRDTRRLKRDGEAVELNVDEVADGVAGLAASSDVGTAGLSDGDGDCWCSC
jgi:hypothetical protein